MQTNCWHHCYLTKQNSIYIIPDKFLKFITGLQTDIIFWKDFYREVELKQSTCIIY